MNSPFVITVVCDACGNATPHDGRYVKSYNPNSEYGILDMDSTAEPREAKIFDDEADLLDFIQQVSSVEPIRPDGWPNRPITGLTIGIVGIDRVTGRIE